MRRCNSFLSAGFFICSLFYFKLYITLGRPTYIYSINDGRTAVPHKTTSQSKSIVIEQSTETKTVEQTVQVQYDLSNKNVKTIGKLHSALETQVQNYLAQYQKQCESSKVLSWNNTDPLCPCIPDQLQGRTPLSFHTTTIDELTDLVGDDMSEGHWKPPSCSARQRVAIIIPFRDRMTHLLILLRRLIPLMKAQLIELKIIVIEQVLPYIFNKAATMNAGYLESKKIYNADCTIFHDVDLLPEDGRNFYTCHPYNIRHLLVSLEKWNYSIGYNQLIGGGLAFPPGKFEAVNGYSNTFFGWGGEDDNMFKRISTVYGTKNIQRYPGAVARYSGIPHHRDETNPWNINSGKGYKAVSKKLLGSDGLSTLKYYPEDVHQHALFTHIKVSLETPSIHYSISYGTCQNTSILSTHEKIMLEPCAERCTKQSDCKSFVHCYINDKKGPRCTLLKSTCNSIVPQESSQVYRPRGPEDPFRPGNTHDGKRDEEVTGFTSTSGDCQKGDLGEGFEGNVQSCAQACNNNSSCKAFSFVLGRDMCYLKQMVCDTFELKRDLSVLIYTRQ